jgi:hypothetical protein
MTSALAVGVTAEMAAARAPGLFKRPQKAVFRVVVEGTGEAMRRVAGTGSNGVCDISTDTISHESYHYGRGRNFEVVFTRFARRVPPIMNRRGRRSPATSFRVQGGYTATAQGHATRRGDGTLCQPVDETVGDENGCGERRGGLDMALNYAEGKLSLDLFNEFPRLPGGGCGSNGVETSSGNPPLGWRGFPVVKPKRLPARRIFGLRHAFVVELSSGPVRQVSVSPIAGFPVDVIDEGEHNAKVRFIRLNRN